MLIIMVGNDIPNPLKPQYSPSREESRNQSINYPMENPCKQS